MEGLLAAWWPALFAGLIAIGVTVAIERFGGVVGGLLGTLPTTIVPASLGIWAGAATADAAADALYAAPPGMLLNALFLWLWRVLPGRLPDAPLPTRLLWMTLLSLTAWTLAATGLVLGLDALRTAGVPMAWVGTGTTVGIGLVGVVATLQPVPAPRGTKRVGPGALVARGVLAGAAVGVAVVLASTGDSLAAGLAAVFPAIFVTTMVGLWLAQGEAVPAGAVGPMMLGSTSVAAYAVFAGTAFAMWGPALGTVSAWGAAVVATTVPAFVWLRRARAVPSA